MAGSVVLRSPALLAYAFALPQADRAHVLTAIADSSDVVDRRFVTYTHEANFEMPGIPSDLNLAAAALRSLSAWHDLASQRGLATLSEAARFPGDRTAHRDGGARIHAEPREALTVAG